MSARGDITRARQRAGLKRELREELAAEYIESIVGEVDALLDKMRSNLVPGMERENDVLLAAKAVIAGIADDTACGLALDEVVPLRAVVAHMHPTMCSCGCWKDAGLPCLCTDSPNSWTFSCAGYEAVIGRLDRGRWRWEVFEKRLDAPCEDGGIEGGMAQAMVAAEVGLAKVVRKRGET